MTSNSIIKVFLSVQGPDKRIPLLYKKIFRAKYSSKEVTIYIFEFEEILDAMNMLVSYALKINWDDLKVYD